MKGVIFFTAAALLLAAVSAQQPHSAQASTAEKIKSNLQKRWNETWALGGESAVCKLSSMRHASHACSGHQ
jgi:hypothetical protein